MSDDAHGSIAIESGDFYSELCALFKRHNMYPKLLRVEGVFGKPYDTAFVIEFPRRP